jgi:hypothetical protein
MNLYLLTFSFIQYPLSFATIITCNLSKATKGKLFENTYFSFNECGIQQTILFNVHCFMLMIKILVNFPINICRHVIGKKMHVKASNFECEMDPQ